MSIVSVQFKSRYSDTYGGKEYAYLSDVPVSEGDIVKVPTKFGDTEAKVARVDVPESEIPSYMELKHITEAATPGGDLFAGFFT